MKRFFYNINLNILPWFVLVCCLVITFLLWRAEDERISQRAELQFELETHKVETAIKERLDNYELMLQGCIGMFNASLFVSRQEWKAYVQGIDPHSNYPGIQGIGFARRVSAAEKAAHIRLLRSEGFLDYTVKPAGDRAEYFPIVYLEPFSGRNLRAFGYDMFFEPVRRTAMEEARDHGMPTLSGKVTLVQETSDDIQSGFLIYLPLYEKNRSSNTVQERRSALLGFVYSPFRAADFINGIFGHDPDITGDVAIAVYDGSDLKRDDLLYRSPIGSEHSFDDIKPLYEKIAAFTLYGRTWTVHYKTLPSYNVPIDRARFFIIVCGSLLVSFLLFAITFLIVVRSERLAAEMIRGERVQAALRMSEQRFRTLAEEMPHFVWETAADGNPLYANKQFYDYTGLNLEQAQAGGWLAVQHPDDVQRVEAAWHQALTAGCDYDLETRFRETTTDTYRWFRIKGNPVLDAAGQIIRWVGTGTDVQEQKQAREALRESEELFRMMANSMPQLAWIARSDGYITWYNARWYEYTGTTPVQMEGSGWQSVHDPKALPEVLERWKHSIATGELFDMEFPLRGADGILRPFLTRGYPLKNEAGRVEQWFGTNTDITERKTIEKTQLFLLQCGTKEGEDFFESLAGYLAENLGMDFVCIDKLTGDRLSAQTLAMYCDGSFEDNVEYALKDTPCGGVVGNEICSFSMGVRRLFPKDAVLQDLRAESYVGTTLWSMRGEPIGLIAVIGRKPLADTAFAESILKLVGIRAAAELEHRAAAEVLLKSNKAYQALSESGKAVITAGNESELMHEAVRIVQKVCGYSLAWIGLAEHDARKTIRITAQAGDVDGYLNAVKVTWGDDELGRGPTGTAIRTRKPVINHNTLTTPSLAPWREKHVHHGFLSSAAFPICTDEEVLGALTVYAPTAHAFTKEETRLLMELSSNLAYGILFMRIENDRKQVTENLRTSNARLDILAETANQLLKSDSPQQMVELLCRRVMTFLDCQVFFNFLVDEARGQLHLNACGGIPQEEAVKIEWLDYGIAVCGCAARDACRIVAVDILNTPDIRTELVKSYGIQAYACHPLVSRGEVIGTLSFGTRTRTHFTDDELSLMKAVADQVAIAMERNQAQVHIAQLNQDLQLNVQELKEEVKRRTHAEQILIQYTEELTHINQELDSFTSVVSHDLQEPLRSIASFLQLLDKKYGDQLDSRGKEFIARSLASSKRLGAMINSLLTYSRIMTRGKGFEHHRLDAILEIALENLHASISQTKAKIIREPLPRVYGDADQLVRVFQNLIGNGIKYCEDRLPEIHVSWQRKGDSCIIAVKDNGEGIDPDYLENIFDLFIRVSSKQNISGTGIGLAVCKKIIGRHNGRIWAESEPGKGSTFFFSIPVS